MCIYLVHLLSFIYIMGLFVWLFVHEIYIFHVNLIICTFQFCVYLFIYLCMYLFIYVLIYFFIVYLFIRCVLFIR